MNFDIECLGVDFQAGEKFPTEGIRELRELDEVACMSGDVVGNFCDNALLIGAVEFENEAFGHGVRFDAAD